MEVFEMVKKWFVLKRKNQNTYLKFTSSDKYGLHLTNIINDAIMFTSEEVAKKYLEKYGLYEDYIVESVEVTYL
jgi:hypothetical protein